MADQKLNIIFTGDVSQLEKELQSAISELTKFEQKLKDSLGAEGFAQINSAVDSLKQKLSSLQAIDIKANPQQALSAINEILVDIAKIKSSEVVLTSDNTDVLSDINQIQARLQDVKSTIKISADLDTKNLEALLKPLSTQVSVDVNTKAAEAELKALLQQVKALKGQDILINLDGTQVVRTIDQIEKELLQLQTKLKTATNPADIARLTQSLQQFKNSLSQTNVNQFSSTMNRAQNATFAFSQVLREAPAFAFSFQTGILALSNNLPILADRLKEARAAGVSFGKIAGDIGKSLFSLPGILTIASTALLFLGDKLFDTGKDAKDAAEKIRSFGEIVGDSTANVQGDAAKVDALVSAFKDAEGSFTKQKRILDELKTINEAYFGELKAGKTTYEEIAAAANKYTEALVAQAVVKGFSDEISKVSTELNKQKEILKPLAVNVSNLAKELKQIKDPEARERQRATNFSTLAYAKQLIVVENLQTEFNKLKEGIKGAVSESLQFKLFDETKGDPSKGLKDETDKIIAQARAFVKQFGDVFETPDLEESFTNTRDKILKSAKKLLDDIDKLNLKIRLPLKAEVLVQVEGSIPREDIAEPLPQAELDKLHKGFLDQLQKEFQEPFTPDITLDVATFNDKIKTQLTNAIKSGNFRDALNSIDINAGNLQLDQLSEDIRSAANLVNDTLTPAFQNLFDAIIKGENPLKAFFDSIVDSIDQVIKKLIQAAIQAAILSAFSGGQLSFGKTLLGLFGGLVRGGNVSSPGFIGSAIGSTAAPTLSAIVRGTDLAFVLQQGQNRIGR